MQRPDLLIAIVDCVKLCIDDGTAALLREVRPGLAGCAPACPRLRKWRRTPGWPAKGIPARRLLSCRCPLLCLSRRHLHVNNWWGLMCLLRRPTLHAACAQMRAGHSTFVRHAHLAVKLTHGENQQQRQQPAGLQGKRLLSESHMWRSAELYTTPHQWLSTRLTRKTMRRNEKTSVQKKPV